jgi:hypothetical protein
MRRMGWALAAAALLTAGCGDYNVGPLAPNPPGTGFPAVDGVLWRNGLAGVWMSQPVQLSAPGGGETVSTVAASDNINGDGQALLVNGGTNVSFSVTNPADPTAFYGNGHFQMDVQSVTPYGPVTGYQISYSGNLGTASYSGAFPGGALQNSAGFVHVSVPFTSFSGYAQTQVYGFNVSVSGYYPPSVPIVEINDVKWTKD